MGTGVVRATGGASVVVVGVPDGAAGRYGAPGTMSVLLQLGHVMNEPDMESGDWSWALH